MQQPLWKKLLSYLFDIHIESTSSEYSQELHVSLVKGRYQLCTANAIYSFADKYDNFGDSFRLMNLEETPIKEVLLLGLGLGSIPYMLEKKMSKNYRYTAVEIDAEVIRLASKYVLDELQSEIEINETDALIFLMLDKRKFDLIAMDIFINVEIPPIFQTTNFLNLLKESLSPKGILMMNVLDRSKEDKERATTYFDEVFKSVFPTACFLKVQGNKILLNHPEILKNS